MTWLTLFCAVALGQEPAADRATLVIREGTREIGRERYTLREARFDDGSTGYMLEIEGTLGQTRSRAAVELSTDWGTQGFSVELTRPDQPVTEIVGVAQGRGKFVVRTRTASGERSQELPMPRAPLLLSDSLFALYAVVGPLEAAGERRVPALFAGSGRRVTATVVDHGMEQTDLLGVPTSLRHLEVQLGDDRRHVWLHPDRRLAKIEVPSRNIVVERLPTGS